MRCPGCGYRPNLAPGAINRCHSPTWAKCRFEWMEPMVERDQLLTEREKMHGNFQTTAEIAQQLKHIFHEHILVNWGPRQVEALDMIATKIARLLSGDNNHADTWKDIAGYAKLGEEACD